CDAAARGRKREPGGGLAFVLEHFGEEHLGAGGEAAAGHLLGIAHQFIKVNFRRGDKSANAAAAFDDSFAFERGQSVARGHEADLMNLGEVALGGDGVPRMQMPGVDAFTNGALNSLVSRQAVAVLGWHSLSDSSALLNSRASQADLKLPLGGCSTPPWPLKTNTLSSAPKVDTVL